MRLVISSDWQSDISNLPRLGVVVDQIVGECSKDPNTFFVHLGDAKEKSNPVDLRVINFLQDSFTRIRKSCRGYYFVRGNHDNINTQDGSPSLCDLVRAWGALEVADESWRHACLPLPDRRAQKFRGLWLYFVPYFRNPIRQREEFKGPLEHIMQRSNGPLKHNDVRLLFFHNTITGVRRNGPDGVGLSAYDIGAGYYDACVGGHEHMPQELPPNITYCGSPLACDFGEVNYRHRILAIDIPEGK